MVVSTHYGGEWGGDDVVHGVKNNRISQWWRAENFLEAGCSERTIYVKTAFSITYHSSFNLIFALHYMLWIEPKEYYI